MLNHRSFFFQQRHLWCLLLVACLSVKTTFCIADEPVVQTETTERKASEPLGPKVDIAASQSNEVPKEISEPNVIVPIHPQIDFSTLQNDEVQIKLFYGMKQHDVWPIELNKAASTFSIDRFALYSLPRLYSPDGGIMQHPNPTLLNMAARVDLTAGTHELLLRYSGMTRVWIDGEIVASCNPVPRPPDGHGKPRKQDIPATYYPRGRLGTQDLLFAFTSPGATHDIVIESLIGIAKAQLQLKEFLMARRDTQTDSWHYLFPQRSPNDLFSPVDAERTRIHQEVLFAQMNASKRQSLRKKLRKKHSRAIDQRHQRAAHYIKSLEPINLTHLAPGKTTIDRFLLTKLKHKPSWGSDHNSEFVKNIFPLIDQHCIRCHGKKAKGDLQFDTKEHALLGGESGLEAIVPGDADSSEMIRRITSDDPDEQMPPKGKRLTTHEVSMLANWIDHGAKWPKQKISSQSVQLPKLLDERTFLRRLYLDTLGVPPSLKQIAAYMEDARPNKKSVLIDQLLANPRHSDHWTSYWQDVFAENPNLVKPKLNNTGPFRWWINESLQDNKPFDQMVRELIAFDGSAYGGGAAGFKIATQNDAPMAAKAHILGTALLGIEMKCARCHDAPYHRSTQKDLFSVAAMLTNKSIELPETSVVSATFFNNLKDRKSKIHSSIKPGEKIEPDWPFEALTQADHDDEFGQTLADLFTRPDNHRFPQVVVNRLWQQYFGQGIVEPVHDWEGATPSHPKLLDYLARAFVSHGYDLQHISRLILNSEAYGRAARLSRASTAGERYFEAPLRRRMSAEQLIDSLFFTSGVPFFSEELTLDVGAFRGPQDFLHFGYPTRAWQFVPVSVERDRPSLSLPNANAMLTLMESYGWRPIRANPISERAVGVDVLQSGLLSNGLVTTWITRLSIYSDMTRMAIDTRSLDTLIDNLYLKFLTRFPDQTEKASMTALLEEGFNSRLVEHLEPFKKQIYIHPVREIGWTNHLSSQANLIVAQAERTALQGPTSSDYIARDWRERFEDAIWLMINTPEFQYLP